MSSIRDPYPKTLAAVKSGVVVSLIETYLELDPEFKKSLPPGEFGITLKSPGIHQNLSINKGRSGVILHFPKWQDMIQVLSGEKGRVIPLPNGFGFINALNIFQSSAAEVGRFMDIIPESHDSAAVELKTRMLLAAALRGVCEVYNHDHWILVKSRNIPAGRIGIRIADRPDMGGVITVDRSRMSLELTGDTKEVNAVLEFQDIPVCYRVLTGDLPALGALGDSRIMLKGKLPMIQGLFPLLDRFGELMS